MDFDLDLFDYATLVTFALAGVAGVLIALWIADLPGQIAIACNYPDAEALLRMPRCCPCL